MGLPLFRFTLTHQTPQGVVEFSNNGFDVSISGWDQVVLSGQQGWTWQTPGYARSDGSSSGLASTAYIGQFKTGGWHPGKYTIDVTARNNSGTAGATNPLQSILNIAGSHDGLSITSITYTGTGTWDVDNTMRTRRVVFETTEYFEYLFFNFSKVGPTSNYEVLIDLDEIEIISAPIVRQISEPDGWRDAILKLERDSIFYSLVEYFEGTFIFYGNNGVDDGGIDFIKNVERTYGFNADILILIEVSFNEGSSYETVYSGSLDLSELQELPDNKMEVPIVQKNLWTTFYARKDTPINVRSTTDLDGVDITPIGTVDLNLISQEIRKKHEATMETSIPYDVVGSSEYIQFDWDKVTLEELDEKITLWRASNPAVPQPIFIAKEAGSYTFDVKIIFTRAQVTGDGSIPDPFIFSWENLNGWLDLYIKKNNENPIAFTRTDQSSGATEYSEYTYNATLSLSEGDAITMYGDVLQNFAAGAPGSELILIGSNPSGSFQNFFLQTFPIAGLSSFLNITGDTIFRDTTAQGFLIHDAFAAVIQGITGKNCFYSEFLGSTTTNARQYDSNGCGWKGFVTKGLQIRGYDIDAKPISWSFMDLWNGENPIMNLCLFYDTIDGEDVIRVEPKSHVFENDPSHNIDNVRQVTREYDHAVIYDKIEVGYKKWQSENISGLDDPHGKRMWATVIKKISNVCQIISEFITAPLATEFTRRTTIEQSKDYKYDNETFRIQINGDDVSPDRYLPELDENFDSITGLLNSDTRYNTIHTPLRMLFRWGNWWTRGLQKYLTTSLKFVSGEANYDLVTNYNCTSGDQCLAVVCDSVAENGNLTLSTYGSTFGFLHLPDLYKISINLSWEDYLDIRNNREKSIAFSQSATNHKSAFLKNLAFKVCDSSTDLEVWAAAEPIEITVIESDQPAPTDDGWNLDFTDEETNCTEIFYQAAYSGDLDGWTSEGGTDIPASTLEALTGWDNSGGSGDPWMTGSTPSITRNGLASGSTESEYIRGQIATVVGLTYEFDWQVEIVGTDPTTARIEFALLDASNNVLASDSEDYSSVGVKSGTVTLSPSGSNGVYFAIKVFNLTPGAAAKTFELQSASLSGGTGSVDVALPSWIWRSTFAGSAKAEVEYHGYGVKNFVLDATSLPADDVRIQIKYALPVNNGNNSLRFRIKDASDTIIHNVVFASDVTSTGEVAVNIDIANGLSDADKFEILVESTGFEFGDTIYITDVTVLQCIDLAGDEFAECYQDLLDYAEAL